MVQSMKKDISSVVLIQLSKRNIPFFIGGSVRFGYDNWSSDLDIFCLSDEESIELLLSGISYTREYPDGSYPGGINQFSVLGGMIHLNAYPKEREDSFLKLQTQHNTVEDFLNSNSAIKSFLPALRAVGVKGKTLFIALLEAARTRKVKQ
jgi:hypothetical protein